MPGFKSPTFGTNTYDGVKALYAGRTVPLELVRPYTPAALRLAAEHAVQDIASYQFNFKNDQAQREVQSALAHVRDLMSGADANDPEALQEVRDALVTLTHGLPGKLKSEKVPIPNARGRFWQGVKMPSSLLQAAGSLYEDKLHAEVTLPSLERRLSRLPQSYQERDPGGTFVNAVDVAKEAIQIPTARSPNE